MQRSLHPPSPRLLLLLPLLLLLLLLLLGLLFLLVRLMAGLSLREALDEESLKPGCFGENLFLDTTDMKAETICVGDMLPALQGS